MKLISAKYVSAFLMVGGMLIISSSAKSQKPECNTLFPISNVVKNNADAPLAYSVKWGLMDCFGEIIVEPDFERFIGFNEGIGILLNEDSSVLVDLQRNKIALKQTRLLTPFSEGVAIAVKDGRCVVLTRIGEIVSELPIECENEETDLIVSHFSDGLAAVSTPEGFGFISSKGEFVIEPQFDFTDGFSDGIASVIIKGKSAVIDTFGRFVIPPNENGNIRISKPSEGMVKVYFTNRTESREIKYYDGLGKIALEICRDYSGDLAEGRIVVNDGDLWGFIDMKGNQIIPLRFSAVKDFSEGLAGAEVGIGKWGFINENGDFVIPPTFEVVVSSFRNGLAYVRKDGQEGYINKKGDWVWKRNS